MGRTDELKRDIEGILALNMPITGLDLGTSSQKDGSTTPTPEPETRLNVEEKETPV